jgi:hypothetical protein
MYDAWQVTFYLSSLAGLVSIPPISEQLDKSLPFQQAVDKAQAAAQAYLTGLFVKELSATLVDPAVQQQIGSDWTVAWGPSTVVVCPNTVSWQAGVATFTATNSAYVVHSQSQNRYVLAIAGTNPSSWFDWIVEDVFLIPGVTWDSALQTWGKSGKPAAPTLTTTPNLTSGTFVGVTYVLGLLDPNTNATLKSFLGSLNLGASETLTVTGHSLGGALSPTVALALIDPEGPLSSLTKSQVLVYPTAGPTPGNTAFAERYLDYLPASIGQHGWQTWNADLWNTYDLVPRAWGIDTLLALPALYALSFEYDVADLVRLTAVATGGAGISELFAESAGTPGRLNTTPVPGNFITSWLPSDCFAYQYQPPNGQLEYLTKPQAIARGIPVSDLQPISLVEQVAYQHTLAYSQYIVPDMVAPPQAKMPTPAEVVRRMVAAI